MDTEQIPLGDKFNRVIDKYKRADRISKRNVESLISIVKRYNAPWEQEGYVFEVETKRNLPSTLTTLACERGIAIITDLACHPFFYRLNFIKQLGLVHLSTNLDASHNRLAHALGTAQCAARFLQSLRNQEDLNILVFQEYAVVIAAFIHDTFHGPFGHSLEMIRDVFQYEKSYRRLDKRYLLDAIQDGESTLRKIIDSAVPEDIRELVVQYITFFCDKDNILESDDSWHEDYYLAQIIDSAFDADRIDFVIRDSKHLGLGPIREEERLYNVIEAVRVLPLQTSEDSECRSIPVKVLCFSLEHRRIIDDFLARRRDLYLDFYENPAKLVLDDMLAHIVYYVLESKQVTLDWWALPERQPIRDLLSAIHRLTDDGLIHFIYEIGGSDPKSNYAMHLLNDLLGNRPFLEIGREEILVSKARNIAQQLLSISEEFEELRKEKLKKKVPSGPSITLSQQEQFEIISRVLDGRETEIVLLYFARLFSGGFLNKFQVERKLWSLLLEDADFREIFHNYLSTRFHQVDEQIINVGDIPHIHITLPTYAATSEDEILEYATEPVSLHRIAYYKNDNVDMISPDLPRREDLKKPILIVSTCSFLANEKAARDRIISVFRQFLYKDKSWLNARWLESQA